MCERTETLLLALRRRGGERGLNLLEIMISLAIIAMVMGGVAAAVVPTFGKAKIKTAEQQAREIRNAAVRWRALKGGGECPTMSQLAQDKEIEATSNNMDDPWTTPYKISCDGDDEITVASSGPDKKDKTNDDIIIPKPAAAKP